MTEGTKSYLIGCHQFLLHPLWVLLAWRLEYKCWPKCWEILGIFLHDIGICGRQYLSDDKGKIGHWRKGAFLTSSIVYRLVYGKLYPRAIKWLLLPTKAFDFCAGHCPEESGFPESKLSRADKRSWLVAPICWLWWNYWIEWNNKGIGVTPPPKWRKLVKENLKRERPMGNHQLYMRNRKKQ